MLLYHDGFDHGIGKWDSMANHSISTGGRNGGRCLIGQNSSVASGWTITPPDASGDATMIVGFAFFQGSSAFDYGYSLRILNSGTFRVGLTLANNGSVSVSTGGSVGAGTIPEDTWVYVEIKVFSHATAGTVEVRINGAPIITDTNVNTGTGALNQVNIYRCANRRFDDLYVLDGVDGTTPQGRANNDFLGDCTVTIEPPTADSSPLQWTPSTGTSHFALVDEAPPSGADYVEHDVNGESEMFTHGGVTGNLLVYGVHIVSQALKSDSGARTMRHRVDSGGTVETFGDNALGTSALPWWDIIHDDPAGGAWSQSAFNALKFGAEVRP